MSAPLSPPITYRQALEQAAAQIAELKTPKPSAEQAVTATAAAADTIISARDRASAHAKRAIHQLWATVNPYDETAVAEFAVQAARIMAAAQQAAAKAAAVGQAHQLAAVGVKAPATQSVPLNVRAPAAVIKNGLLVLRQHVVNVDYAGGSARVSEADMSTLAVFKRPAAVHRYAKSQGATDVQAAAMAGQRIDDLIDDNLMLAQRLAQQQVLVSAADPVDLDGRPQAKTKIIGYRRVIHPELSRGGTCGMCIAASDRIYHVAELMPIHAHCKCTIAAITEDYDPADDLNAVDLNQLYKDAGGTSSAHLKRTRYKVDQHGELGPVMVPKSKYKPRTTKSKVRVGGTALQSDQPAQAEVAKHQLRVMEENLARLRSDGEPEGSSKIAYHEKLIEKLRRQAGDDRGDSATPPRTGSGDDGKPPKPPNRVTGMLGPDGDDEFGEFDGYTPPATRSQIDDFTTEDALSLLDGDVTPEESRRIAGLVAKAASNPDFDYSPPHGGHRYGSNWGKSEFDPSWQESDVQDWARAIIDNPTSARPAGPPGAGFILSGYYNGTAGELVVRQVGRNSWMIVTGYPLR
ncbi:hypothetical protein A5784_35105 [Mycobacterium sp. 852013-50091_SCH5140682]|uniref:EndoU domain-containing protein n=1 Tax=Mycobacterium sp. 852013-50091_SCH5140682 TaxID=1834109 RepID=UPI0007EB089F|nr:EndoU domain-containing protein [Mycobacterium sp. 852013-50091_SCH5140682]OBC11428.1 hypothetical protein A5784_35105 [Mycobacterium sp. 852013-50091_SCH5140682]